MPNISAHMAIAKRACEKINIDKENFYKGNLLPDLYDDKVKSHFKIQGTKFMIPNIDEALKKLDCKDSLYLGYISHLLLDKYYYEEYLPKYDLSLYEDNILYKDYDVINKDIINHFKIDKEYLKNILKDFPDEINNKKLISIISYLDYNMEKKLIVLNKKDFINFLEESSKRIIDDLNKIIGGTYE
jgi:hypothetical protein